MKMSTQMHNVPHIYFISVKISEKLSFITAVVVTNYALLSYILDMEFNPRTLASRLWYVVYQVRI